jgi:uracil-DNA glycosylase
MSSDPNSARTQLWLRGERAFGLDSVPVSTAPAGSELFSATSSPDMTRDQRISLLTSMDDQEVKPCTRCRLCESRRHTVFGEGDPEAKIFFIGEGPGENEDLQGRPFVGRAGALLDKMIVAMGLKREQVYIANIVKCRPPDNRVPAPDETAACTPYLVRQLEIIRPKAIVTLGLPASKYMLGSNLSMGKLRGQWHDWRGIKLMPTYHPAFLLRSYTEENRAAVWSDLQKVMAEVGLTAPRRTPN